MPYLHIIPLPTPETNFWIIVAVLLIVAGLSLLIGANSTNDTDDD